ncbi:MAG: OmpA family protein [Flavobacterium sp.]|nr:MAG: OmpA family protein [Flavobacterium sp.]
MKRILLILLIFPCALFSQTSADAGTKVEVFFEFDKYFLNDESVQTLEKTLQQNPNIIVSKIYGYCDWKGSNSYNDTLSVRRVNEVYHFLRNKGIKIKPGYETKGFGEDFKQSEVQAENRKVVVMYEQLQPEQPDDSRKALADLVKNAAAGDKIKLKNINFLNNSAILVPKSKPVLYDLLCVMEENPTLKIEIQGHICCQTQADQYDVSSARARAVYMFLLRNKIDRKRLSFKGFGITRPIHPIPEKSEEEADENRRVEIMIVAK